jgi:hypothetical protein
LNEYTVEIVTEPTGEALDRDFRMNFVQRLPTIQASIGLSQDGNFAARLEVNAADPEAALKLGLELFRQTADQFGLAPRVRRLIVAPVGDLDQD